MCRPQTVLVLQESIAISIHMGNMERHDSDSNREKTCSKPIVSHGASSILLTGWTSRHAPARPFSVRPTLSLVVTIHGMKGETNLNGVRVR